MSPKYTIKSIIIYPIKGMAGVSVERALALPIGFAYDRRWMLIDANGNFMSQRNYPELALFQPSISTDGQQITINYKGHEIMFGVSQLEGKDINTTVWDDPATVVEVSQSISNWCSEQLSQEMKFVRLKDQSSRRHYASVKGFDIDVSLADGYPYLVVGTESLELLNRKLSYPVPMNRFRPNIIVNTMVPHEEDTWKNFQISSASFYNVKPCGRCQVVTIDQSTAEINNEILKVLNNYRRQGNNVMFGTNVVASREGWVKVGDEIILSNE